MDLINRTEKNSHSLTESASVNLAEHVHDLLDQINAGAPSNCHDKAQLHSLHELSVSSNADLERIYSNSPAGALPHGDTKGQAIFQPGTHTGEVVSHLGNQVWTGKVFQENGDLVNKIFGHKLVHADVLKGASWSDGKESIIIDYKDKSYAAGWIRDEIREVQPGLYLGKMYARLPFHQHTPVLFFALEANKR